MRRSLASHVIIVTGFVVAMPAAAGPDGPKAASKLPAIETFALSNGLQVAVLHNEVAPVISVQVWYHVGSKDEPRERRGEAHMFEHMMFKGTSHVRPEAQTQSITALGGYVNAATDEDSTHYANTLPSDYLDYALRLEADRMRNLMFRKPMIDVEREVVKDEIRQQDGTPSGRGLLRCLELSYQKHPYAWTASGVAKDLDQTTPEDLKKFYDTYYEPNNALLVVVGKVTTAAVKASAEKWFGAVPKAGDPPRPAAAAQEAALPAKRREVLDPGPIGLLLVGWRSPAARDKDIDALQIAALVLGAGDSSRLRSRFKALDPKAEGAFALEAGIDAMLREDPGMVIVLGRFPDPAQAGTVEAAIFDEVGKLAARGPTGDELRKAKNQMQSGFVFSLESADGLAAAIGRSWILTGDPSSFLRSMDEVENISAADVQRVVKHYLSPDHATVVVIPPRAR